MRDTDESSQSLLPLDPPRRLLQAVDDGPRAVPSFLGHTRRLQRRPEQGAKPGEMVVPEDSPEPIIHVMSYSASELDELASRDLETVHRVLGTPGRTIWIDVVGFGSRQILEEIRETLGIHDLAMADIVHTHQRPKAELYDGRLLVISQMARVTEADEICIEQVSFVLGPGWVASFQETPGDVFDPVRARIRFASSRIRESPAEFLLYALIDAVVDGYFPVVEELAVVVEALEEEVVESATRACLTRIHATRRTLLTLHRVHWRQRDAINVMIRDETLPLSDAVKPYLRDVHDHAFQTLDAIETYRDMMMGLLDLHLSSTSHRLNEVMKTLTIVATIFIPLTFLTGVYGMNFDYIPELHYRWAYPAFWIAIVGMGIGLLLWFRYRGWIGSSDEPDE